MNPMYHVVIIEDDLSEEEVSALIQISSIDFNSSGYEEFSLSESEVDKILGKEAFCGGDLSDGLLNHLETEAGKKYKFFFIDESAKTNAEAFRDYLKEIGGEKISLIELEEEDWIESWKKHYSPIELNKFMILPVWEKQHETSKEKIIINPGMGFGTGTHETTRLCLELLEEHHSEATLKSCLDFGSGSGILGIGFQKFCNGEVDYVDIDQRALDNNLENLKLNFLKELPISEFYLREDFKLNKTYDLVFANILEHVLIEEFELLRDSLDSGNVLIVSGILLEQKENIINKFSTHFDLEKEKEEGDWAALSFRKK
ncbi:MAG: ribosomal protein L11 methyltransferase [Bacteriovoracaceae bacterium]|jgi:ribosomal protein L11 methyltransferase